MERKVKGRTRVDIQCPISSGNMKAIFWEFAKPGHNIKTLSPLDCHVWLFCFDLIFWVKVSIIQVLIKLCWHSSQNREPTSTTSFSLVRYMFTLLLYTSFLCIGPARGIASLYVASVEMNRATKKARHLIIRPSNKNLLISEI